MDFSVVWQQFLDGMNATSWLEYVAVLFGIISVYFSRKENILVYPTGLINTTFYVYLSLKGHLFGEASVNLYYTIMSIYGWYLWARKNEANEQVLRVTYSTKKEWAVQLGIFAVFYAGIYLALTYLKNNFYAGALPWADAFASATAYTGMWLMAKKKVESWVWWILTNVASIPLYYVKGYVFTSVYYVVLLILAVSGLQLWQKKARMAAEKA